MPRTYAWQPLHFSGINLYPCISAVDSTAYKKLNGAGIEALSTVFHERASGTIKKATVQYCDGVSVNQAVAALQALRTAEPGSELNIGDPALVVCGPKELKDDEVIPEPTMKVFLEAAIQLGMASENDVPQDILLYADDLQAGVRKHLRFYVPVPGIPCVAARPEWIRVWRDNFTELTIRRAQSIAELAALATQPKATNRLPSLQLKHLYQPLSGSFRQMR